MHGIMKFNHVFNNAVHILLMLNMFMYFTHGSVQLQSSDKSEKHVKTIDKTAVEGRRISLPCPLSAPSRDKVYMVLWFKDDAGIPLYSFDVRGKPLQQARHWSAPEIFGSRAKFNTDIDPATLEIEDIRRHDEGTYRCRVDFRTSQTQSFRYNLTVIILPEHPVVLNRWGRQLNGTLLGPKEEGDDILLTCRVIGGRPQPSVRWLVNGLIVDDQVEQNTGDVTENRLMWPAVSRNDLNSIFTCQAMNTQLVEPRESTFVLDLHLKPLTVKIMNPSTPLVADRRYEVQCESSGSRPNAIITWYKGKRQLRRAKDEILTNTTKSVLNFVPTTEDDGKSITCRAENPKITPAKFMETTWKLDVVYPPLVNLRLGSTLSADDIKEGDDVYFECQVQANPQWRKLYWLHDGVLIAHNASARVIRSNQSLVLQKITRNSTGNYSCSAINAEGETVSNQLPLRVKYAPVCVTDKIVIVGAFRSENLNVVCEVHADPPPRSFKWKFNSSGETYEIAKDRYNKNGSKSVLHYTPIMDQDYGSLTCQGTNEVGEQTQPCVFQVILAGLPSTVKNCSISNQTQHSLELQCIPGYDGGLPQVFLLELIASKSGKLRFNMTNTEEPFFSIDSLDAYTSFDTYGDNALKAIIFAVNQKGRSHGVVIRDFLFENNVENRAVMTSASMDFSPILLGILFTLVLLCLVIFAKVYCVRVTRTTSDLNNDTKQMNNINYKPDAIKKNSSPRWQHSENKSKELKTTTDIIEDERDPDVIPAQYVSNSDETNSYSVSEWANSTGSGNAYYNQFINQNARLKDPSISTNSTITALSPNSQSISHSNDFTTTSNHHTPNSFFGSNPFCSPKDIIPNGNNGTLSANQIDYDLNINAIKTLLMTTKVPESCV
ncbi:unnamed protein product [Diamesa hyperborea]